MVRSALSEYSSDINQPTESEHKMSTCTHGADCLKSTCGQPDWSAIERAMAISCNEAS